MLLSTAEDLGRFVEELKRETDRGLPLVATALIDELLKETLRSLFCDKTAAVRLLDEINAPLGSFSSRTDACFALGLIDAFEHREVTLLRKVRNEFAHAKHGITFDDSRIRGLCSSLKSDLPGDGGYPIHEPRFRFTNAAVVIVLRLYHRPDWVRLEQRQPKKWVADDATRWRSFKDEPPPSGISPIMVLGKSDPS
ncbi:hypothetical protein I6F11_06020 [Ensifer sp. NBAIM29]|nr:hypothetical protein [Ensifer sp. NBAIM29]